MKDPIDFYDEKIHRAIEMFRSADPAKQSTQSAALAKKYTKVEDLRKIFNIDQD